MSPREIFEGSNGSATQALYAELALLGPAGVIALNLFRACKCSSRAKEYRPKYKREAYGRKEWSLQNLCDELSRSAEELGIEWGWKEDPKQACHKWVLYVVIPTGQVSFHNEKRLHARDFPHEWDGEHQSSNRIIKWTTMLLNNEPARPQATPGRAAGLKVMEQALNGKDHDTSERTQHPEPVPPLQRQKLVEAPARRQSSARGLEMLELWEVAIRARDD